MYMKITSPLKVIMRWNGSPSTDNTLCPSIQARWPPLRGRKVKKSVNIFLWVMMPLMMATSMNIPAMLASQRPQGKAISSSKWKR
ncbi:Uncharacterised protein [Bordetella pertussis]|nr:Uncharacterised protein [Bordetella pertussis]CFP47539.1 Uncharacterised protein [Bordetella pertussis]CFU51943.1 Uncharacterised protein [Bordetella pertussis]CPN57117.1 Uncharacterised protein [Bordetella pertussis]